MALVQDSFDTTSNNSEFSCPYPTRNLTFYQGELTRTNSRWYRIEILIILYRCTYLCCQFPPKTVPKCKNKHLILEKNNPYAVLAIFLRILKSQPLKMSAATENWKKIATGATLGPEMQTFSTYKLLKFPTMHILTCQGLPNFPWAVFCYQRKSVK